jgi:hypothetical protein
MSGVASEMVMSGDQLQKCAAALLSSFKRFSTKSIPPKSIANIDRQKIDSIKGNVFKPSESSRLTSLAKKNSNLSKMVDNHIVR